MNTQSSARKHLFLIMNITETQNQSKCSYEAHSQWIHLQSTPTPKVQGTLWKREQKHMLKLVPGKPRRPLPYTTIGSFLQGRAHQLVIQHRPIRPENVHWVTLHKLTGLYLGIYMSTHIQICNNQWKRRPWIWNRAQKGIGKGLEGEKGWKKWCSCINCKRKEKKLKTDAGGKY